MNLSSNLKFLRKRYDYSQKRLAVLLDLKHSSISNYEKGVSYPEFATLMKLREIFKIDLETLVFGDVAIFPSELKISSSVETTEGCMMAGGCVLRRVAVLEGDLEKIKNK